MSLHGVTRFRSPAELYQCTRTIAVGIGKIRLMDDRVVEARERFVVRSHPFLDASGVREPVPQAIEAARRQRM